MSDAFDQMKNMKDYSTQTSAEKETFKYDKDEKRPGVIKNFILKYGRKLVDFMTGLGFVVAGLLFIIFIGSFIASLFPDQYGGYPNINLAPLYFLYAIVAPLIVLLLTILSNYFMYLLIDIRDSLKNIESK